MNYVLLLVAAFLFFILDRKIRFAVIPGTVATVCAWCSLIYNYFYTAPALSFVPVGSFSVIDQVKPFSLLAPLDATILYSAITVMLFAVFGKLIGKLIFDAAVDELKAQKKAKAIFLIASIITGVTRILYFVFDALKHNVGRNYAYVNFMKFYGVSLVTPIANREKVFVVIYILLIIMSILCIVLINTKLASFRTIASPSSEGDAPVKKTSGINAFAIIGLCVSCVGNIGFLIVDAAKKKASYDETMTLLFMKNLYNIMIIIGLIFIAVGVNKLIRGKGKMPAVIPVISAAVVIASYIAMLLISIDTMKFLTAVMSGSDILLSMTGPSFVGKGPSSIVNALTFLLVLLCAGSVFLIISLIRSSAKKED